MERSRKYHVQLKDQNELDTSLFDPEHDMDLVSMINNARTDREIQSVASRDESFPDAGRAQLKRPPSAPAADAADRSGPSAPSSVRNHATASAPPSPAPWPPGPRPESRATKPCGMAV